MIFTGLEITSGAICMTLLSMLFWVIRRLFKQNTALNKMVHNDINHVQDDVGDIKTEMKAVSTLLDVVVEKFDRLPCGGCPDG